MNVTHIFWDWNGTLLEDAWLCLDVMNRMLARRGMPKMTEERYQSLFDIPVRRYYEKMGFDFERESFEVLGMEFVRGYEQRRREAQLYGDAVTALRRVKACGLGQSILSAYQQDTLVSLVNEHGLDEFFHTVHGQADHYAEGKTPQGRRALEEMGIDPAETVLIGDMDHDADVARELGMSCVLIPGGNQTLDRLRATGCPLYSSRIEALAALGI